MPVVIDIVMIKITYLLVVEGERSSEVIRAQKILCAMRIIGPIKLKGKKPMKLHIYNKGAVDLAKN